MKGAKNDLADRQNEYIEPPEPDVPWDWSIETLEEVNNGSYLITYIVLQSRKISLLDVSFY